MNPKDSAEEQPTAAEEKGPFKMPKSPSADTASAVPFAILAPNPRRGTLTPAPPSLKSMG